MESPDDMRHAKQLFFFIITITYLVLIWSIVCICTNCWIWRGDSTQQTIFQQIWLQSTKIICLAVTFLQGSVCVLVCKRILSSAILYRICVQNWRCFIMHPFVLHITWPWVHLLFLLSLLTRYLIIQKYPHGGEIQVFLSVYIMY